MKTSCSFYSLILALYFLNLWIAGLSKLVQYFYGLSDEFIHKTYACIRIVNPSCMHVEKQIVFAGHQADPILPFALCGRQKDFFPFICQA